MRFQSEPFWLDLTLELVDQILMAAAVRAPHEQRETFLQERDAISGIEIVDIREARFQELDARWLDRFRVADRLRKVVEEHPWFRDRDRELAGCRLRAVRMKSDEHVRLFENGEAIGESDTGPVLALHVRPESVLATDRLRTLFRRDLRDS